MVVQAVLSATKQTLREKDELEENIDGAIRIGHQMPGT
jgi:hypothetical protein